MPNTLAEQIAAVTLQELDEYEAKVLEERAMVRAQGMPDDFVRLVGSGALQAIALIRLMKTTPV